MRIDPAPFLRPNDADSETGHIEGGKGQDQDEAFECIGGSEAAGLSLETARFLDPRKLSSMPKRKPYSANVDSSVGSELATLKAII